MSQKEGGETTEITKGERSIHIAHPSESQVKASDILSKIFQIFKAKQFAVGFKVYLIDTGLKHLTSDSGLNLDESMKKAALDKFYEELDMDAVQIADELLDIIVAFVETDPRMKPTSEQLDRLRTKSKVLIKTLDKIDAKK